MLVALLSLMTIADAGNTFRLCMVRSASRNKFRDETWVQFSNVSPVTDVSQALQTVIQESIEKVTCQNVPNAILHIIARYMGEDQGDKVPFITFDCPKLREMTKIPGSCFKATKVVEGKMTMQFTDPIRKQDLVRSVSNQMGYKSYAEIRKIPVIITGTYSAGNVYREKWMISVPYFSDKKETPHRKYARRFFAHLQNGNQDNVVAAIADELDRDFHRKPNEIYED